VTLRCRRLARTIRARHPAVAEIPHRVNRHLAVTFPIRSCVPTCTGWLYVAVVAVAGLLLTPDRGLSHSPPTTSAHCDGGLLDGMATAPPRPEHIPHSDQGSQYRAGLYLQLSAKHGVVPSL
jgi:transposase InsO family protein